MLEAEWKRLSGTDLYKEYPDLKGWFSGSTNITAQLFAGERLQSAEEKMNLFGGLRKVKETLAKEPRSTRPGTAILMACRNEPMTDFEIRIFEHNAGLKPDELISNTLVKRLLNQDLIGITGGVTYVTRSRNPDLFFLIEDRIGFITTNVIWGDVELQAEERDTEAEKVARLAGHPKVCCGEWISPYQAFSWKLIESLPGKFAPAIKMAEAVMQPRFDWEPEAFRIEHDLPTLASLQLALRSRGRAPLNVPFWGRPTLKLKEVISPILFPYLERFPAKLRYREFLKLTLPVIFSSRSEGSEAENIDPGQIPAYDRIVIKPFWLFAGQGENEHAVAEDPFRLVFQISGAPVAYMKEELQRVNAILGDKKIDMRTIFFEG